MRMNTGNQQSEQTSSKWMVAFAVVFGAFMAVMDVSVVNVALPYMMGTFAVSATTITWVATSYNIAQMISTTMSGWWSTLLGRKRLYMGAFGVFILGSLLAGSARTFTEMMIFRALQGFGGGFLIPVSQAILREAFPARQQGLAMSIFGMGVILAPGIGPVVGGLLTDHYGWPWIFYINVPISVIGFLLVGIYVYDPKYLRRGITSIDWFGIILMTIGLTALQIVLAQGQRVNWFSNQWIVIGTIVAFASLASFSLWELRESEPIINLRLLRNRAFAAGSSIGLIYGIGLFGTVFIIPQFTERLLGYDAYHAGLVVMPRALALLALMPIAGWLYNYIDSRILVGVALFGIFWSYIQLSQLSMNIGLWSMAPEMLLMGASMAFVFVPLSTVSLVGIKPADMTQASSFYTLTRLLGGNIGYAVVATLVADYSQIHRSQLVKHMAPTRHAFAALHQQASDYLVQAGHSAHAASQTAYAIINHQIDNQSEMMAYNTSSWILGLIFLGAIAFVPFLPGRRRAAQMDREAGKE